MIAKGFKAESFRVWMTIDIATDPDYPDTLTPIDLEVSKFAAQFGVNSIPQASCAVALGYQVPDTSVISNMHIIAEGLRYRSKATVYMQVKQGYSNKPPEVILNTDTAFDGNTFIIFDGYASGSGMRRSGSSFEYVISLEHWLSDLSNSTALSPDLVPGTPFNLYFPAAGQTPESSKSPGIGFSLVSRTILQADIRKDIWASLKKYFIAVAGTNQINPESTPTENARRPSLPVNAQDIFKSKKNNAALAALEKFASPGSTYYSAIKLKDDIGGSSTASKILETFHGVTLNTFDGTTFWDNLITFGASFQFSVSPSIKTAWVFPKLPNFRDPYITIRASEINSLDVSTSMPRFISGVVVRGAYGSSTGFFNFNNAAPGSPTAVMTPFTTGMYFSPRHYKSVNPGMIIMQKAPNWLSIPMTNKEEETVKARLTVPNIGAVDILRGEAVAQYAGLQGYANSVYNLEVLKYRNGNLTGKFRLDIAPGTIVKIETDGETRRSGDTLDQAIYASVDQVSHSIDSVAGQASTSFTISSVRSDKENDDDDLTTKSNPLYDAIWKGAPMYVR